MGGDGEPEPYDVDLLIAGGWLITMNEHREVYRDGAVAVSGSKIVAVGRRADLAARYRASRVIDTSRMVVTPGLVNGHRHLLCCPKGALPEGRQTLEALRNVHLPVLCRADRRTDARVRTACHCRDDPLRHDDVRGTRLQPPRSGTRSARHIRDPLPASGPGLGPAGAIRAAPTCLTGWSWTPTPPSTASVGGIDTVRAFGNPLIRDAVTIEGVGNLLGRPDPRRRRSSPRRRTPLLFSTRRRASARWRWSCQAFGERPVQHMRSIGALNPWVLLNHMTSLDEFEVELVADSGARISQNPSSALKFAKGTTQTGKWPELLAAGVPIALGTDAENVSNHQDICRSMQLAALLPRDALA